MKEFLKKGDETKKKSLRDGLKMEMKTTNYIIKYINNFQERTAKRDRLYMDF